MRDARVTAVQFGTGTDVDANIATALRILDGLDEVGVQHDLVCLPEMLTFRPLGTRPTAEIAVAHTHRIRDELSIRARRLGSYLVAGYIMAGDDGRRYNVVDVFDRDGVRMGEHRKTHLFDAPGHDESSHVIPGDALTLVETDFGPVGLIVCYELRFPEVARTLAMAGAELFVVPNSWPADGRVRAGGDLSVLLAATAVQNQAYVLHCNQVGMVGGLDLAGGSCVIDPKGARIADAGAGNCVVTARIDGATLRDVRAARSVFAHRRPELYHPAAVARLNPTHGSPRSDEARCPSQWESDSE